MSHKKTYYVKVATGEVNRLPIEDNSVEYEIYATYEEALELENLFHEQNKAGSKAAEYHYAKPWDDKEVDQELTDYDQEMVLIYEKIYQLGTPETRRQIEEIGILNQK